MPRAGPAAKGARRRLDWPEAGEAMEVDEAHGMAPATCVSKVRRKATIGERSLSSRLPAQIPTSRAMVTW